MSFNIGENGLQEFINTLPSLVMHYGGTLLMALLIFYIGRWAASYIAVLFERSLTARNVDTTISRFTKNIVHYALLIVVCIAALGQLGLETASFVAIIGAAGLAVGFALQGSLSNFASGVMLILFRPFKVGDYVDAGGDSGTVNDISILTTTLKTPDNKTVIIANSTVMSSNITNYSAEPKRRIDLTIGVSYSSDLTAVKNQLHNIAMNHPAVLQSDGITIAVSELADSSVNFAFRVWVATADYWPTRFELNEMVKIHFDENNIEIPYPHLNVQLDTTKETLKSKHEAKAAPIPA